MNADYRAQLTKEANNKEGTFCNCERRVGKNLQTVAFSGHQKHPKASQEFQCLAEEKARGCEALL